MRINIVHILAAIFVVVIAYAILHKAPKEHFTTDKNPDPILTILFANMYNQYNKDIGAFVHAQIEGGQITPRDIDAFIKERNKYFLLFASGGVLPDLAVRNPYILAEPGDTSAVIIYSGKEHDVVKFPGSVSEGTIKYGIGTSWTSKSIPAGTTSLVINNKTVGSDPKPGTLKSFKIFAIVDLPPKVAPAVFKPQPVQPAPTPVVATTPVVAPAVFKPQPVQPAPTPVVATVQGNIMAQLIK
jgi:hypothetical protein